MRKFSFQGFKQKVELWWIWLNCQGNILCLVQENGPCWALWTDREIHKWKLGHLPELQKNDPEKKINKYQIVFYYCFQEKKGGLSLSLQDLFTPLTAPDLITHHGWGISSLHFTGVPVESQSHQVNYPRQFSDYGLIPPIYLYIV